MKNFPILFNFMLVVSALYVVASVIYFFAGLPFSTYVLLSALVPLIFLTMRVAESRRFIDNKIQSVIGDLKDYSVYTKSLPGYRFVDIHNAVLAFCSQTPTWIRVESQQVESLAQILNEQFFGDANRRIKIPEKVARPVAERTEGFFAADSFWLRAQSFTGFGGVVRVRLQDYTHETILEVASKEQEQAEEIIKRVVRGASAHSIFKNKNDRGFF